MLKDLFEQKITLTGSLTAADALKKWEKASRSTLNPPKGGVFYEYKKENEKCRMYYHTNYKKDMCDTVFEGEITPYSDSCQVNGAVKTTPGIRRISVLIFILGIALGILFIFFPLIDYPFIFIIIGTGASFLTMKANKGKAAYVEEELQRFINNAELRNADESY